MPSSQPGLLSATSIPELQDQLNALFKDIYAFIDIAMRYDGKGVMQSLQYGGLGRDLRAVSAILGALNGASIDVAPLNAAGGLTDVTTLNASATAHGFLPKLSDVITQFLSGQGTWIEVPAAVLYDANTILKADVDNTPVALTIAEQTIVGRITAGVITALTVSEVLTLLGIPTEVSTTTLKADHVSEKTAAHGVVVDHPVTLPAGASAAGKGPLKFTVAGAALLTAPEEGALEPFTDDLYFTITTGAARKQVVLTDGFPLTPGNIPVAGANGRLEDGPTEINVDSAVSLKHTAGTDTALGAVGTKNPPIDADLALYRDSAAANVLVTSTWTQVKAFLKTYFDTLYVAVTGRYRYAAALADTGTITLPTITANYPAHGFIHCAHASTGVISESAEFEFGSTGAVQIIRGTANIEANGATAGKISLGPAVAANPVVIKNNLGGGVSVNAMITLWYN